MTDSWKEAVRDARIAREEVGDVLDGFVALIERLARAGEACARVAYEALALARAADARKGDCDDLEREVEAAEVSIAKEGPR